MDSLASWLLEELAGKHKRVSGVSGPLHEGLVVSQYPPGSQSGPVRAAGFAVPTTGPHRRSLSIFKH